MGNIYNAKNQVKLKLNEKQPIDANIKVGEMVNHYKTTSMSNYKLSGKK